MQNQISQLIDKFKDKGYEVEETIASNDKEDLVAAYYLEEEEEKLICYDLLIFQNGMCRVDNLLEDEYHIFSWKVSIQDLLIMSWSDIFDTLLKHEIIQLLKILEDLDYEVDDITDSYDDMKDLVAAYYVVKEANYITKDTLGVEELEHHLLIFQNRMCRLYGIDHVDFWENDIQCLLSPSGAEIDTLFIKYA